MSKSSATYSGALKPSIEADGSGVLRISGRLDVDTVADCRDAGDALLASAPGPGLTVDLSGTEVHGSAAVALLIAWQRKAREHELELTLAGAPEKLLAIADACGVRTILPFADTGP